MGIDWFTLSAQMFNFLVLVWFLNRFLFSKILAVVEERNQRIREEYEGAAAQKEEASQEKELFSKERDQIQREKSMLLSQAVQEAKQEKERLITIAQEEYESTRNSLKDQLGRDQEQIYLEVKERVEQEVCRFVRRALEEVANSSLEEQIARVFIKRLHRMGGEQRRALEEDIRNSSLPVVLKSGFELSSEDRLYIEKGLRELFGYEVACSFQEDSSVICGVELISSSYKLQWNLSQYVLSLRASL